MVQVPAATSVAAAPDTVHTPVVDEVKVTVRPELAVAVSVTGPVPRVADAGAMKVMVCGVSSMMLVGSAAVSLAVFSSAGLLTIAVLVTFEAAVLATFTVTVTAG
jgi:hypothetical protein